jgi:hypothetical protein
LVPAPTSLKKGGSSLTHQDLRILRLAQRTLKNTRHLVGAISEEKAFQENHRYLFSYLYRSKERSSLLDQITRILKEYNGVAENFNQHSDTRIDGKTLQILEKLLLEEALLVNLLSLEVQAICEDLETEWTREEDPS